MIDTHGDICAGYFIWPSWCVFTYRESSTPSKLRSGGISGVASLFQYLLSIVAFAAMSLIQLDPFPGKNVPPNPSYKRRGLQKSPVQFPL